MGRSLGWLVVVTFFLTGLLKASSQCHNEERFDQGLLKAGTDSYEFDKAYSKQAQTSTGTDVYATSSLPRPSHRSAQSLFAMQGRISIQLIICSRPVHKTNTDFHVSTSLLRPYSQSRHRFKSNLRGSYAVSSRLKAFSQSRQRHRFLCS